MVQDKDYTLGLRARVTDRCISLPTRGYALNERLPAPVWMDIHAGAVGLSAFQGRVTTLVSSATAAMRASARPSRVAPVPSVMA